jgi:hypothetical protein
VTSELGKEVFFDRATVIRFCRGLAFSEDMIGEKAFSKFLDRERLPLFAQIAGWTDSLPDVFERLLGEESGLFLGKFCGPRLGVEAFAAGDSTADQVGLRG